MHVAELVGGPRDGELQEFDQLPQTITVVGLPADHYAQMVQPAEVSIMPVQYLEGVYRFDRLTWTFYYWRDGFHPVTAGLYVWQGYR